MPLDPGIENQPFSLTKLKHRFISFTNMTNDNNAISFPTKAHKALGFRDIPPQISTPGRPSNAEADWVTCWIAADAYSRTTTNVKFLLRRDIKTLCDEVEEWITFVDQRDRFTTESLGYVADMWPQIVDSFVNGSPYSAAGMVAGSLKLGHHDGIELDEASAKRWVRYWYPTLSMNLQVHRALPPGGVDWLWQKVWATEIGNGRMDVQVIIADTEGVVAIGYLSVMIVEQTRNQRAASDRRKSKM